ncbi:MAG: hypothetical protein WCF16_08060, partial [Alphaproteobacteria bacterium]
AHAGSSADFGGPAATSPRTAPGEEAGAYARLSADDQRIARALMDAQTLRRDGAQCWSLDRIADARTGSRDWAEVFHAMHTDGLLAERSLAQVTQRFDREGSSIGIGPEMVITTAAGDQIRVATHSYRDTAYGSADGEDEATRLAQQYGEPTEDETMAPASGPQ